MKTLTDNKSILAIVTVFVLLIIMYTLLFKPDTAMIGELPTGVVGNEVLETFTNLEQVKLDQSIFSMDGYLLLTDFSTSIPTQATGRSNPFDVIGRN